MNTISMDAERVGNAVTLTRWACGPTYIRLLCGGGLNGEFRELGVRRDPDCAYCAEGRPFPGYIDYEQFCAAE